jgi:ribosomal protein L22
MEEKTQDKKIEEKPAEVKKEAKSEVVEKPKENKQEEKPVEANEKKTEAVINGKDLHISTKHSIAVCNFIRNKNIEKAIEELELAEKMKKPIPMRGEIPHKKGIMSGRYPVNAIKAFIKLLKSLKANAIVNELELEKYKIFCKANIASRPYKRFGQGRSKRTHVQIKLIPITKQKRTKSKQQNKGDKK